MRGFVFGDDGRGVDPRVAADLDDDLASFAADATHWLVSIPPDERGDPVQRLVTGAPELTRSLRWVGLLSTTGMFGDRSGSWIDEDTPPTPMTDRGRRRLEAESAWARELAGRPVALQVFRLTGIYGPGRSAFERIVHPGARRIVKPGSVFNRIHVDDVVGAVEAGLRHDAVSGIFHVADDEPASNHDVLTWAADRLGVARPPETAYADAGLSPMARSFYEQDYRVSNRRLREVLGWRPRYPTYREGLEAVLGERDRPLRGPPPGSR